MPWAVEALLSISCLWAHVMLLLFIRFDDGPFRSIVKRLMAIVCQDEGSVCSIVHQVASGMGVSVAGHLFLTAHILPCNTHKGGCEAGAD